MEFPMGDQENQSFHTLPPQEAQQNKGCDSTSSSSSSSSTITDVMEDASSSTSSLNGPLYELNDLVAHLPIKKGLSKYYDGKAESFTSMESVKSLEDLAKKERPSYNNKRKRMCKRVWSPKPTIAKKVPSRASLLSTMLGKNIGI